VRGDIGEPIDVERVASVPNETLVGISDGFIHEAGPWLSIVALDFGVYCEFQPVLGYHTIVDKYPKIMEQVVGDQDDADTKHAQKMLERFYEEHLRDASELALRRRAIELTAGKASLRDQSLAELCLSALCLQWNLMLGSPGRVYEISSGDVVTWVAFEGPGLLDAEQVAFLVFIRGRLAYEIRVAPRSGMYGKTLPREALATGWRERLTAIHRSILTEALELNETLRYHESEYGGNN